MRPHAASPGHPTWKVRPDILECGGNLNSRIDRNPGYLCHQGAVMGNLPAAALDLAMVPFHTKALRPGESAVAAARQEPDAQVSGKRRWNPPLLRFDSAAPLCRRTPKQSAILKEPLGKGVDELVAGSQPRISSIRRTRRCNGGQSSAPFQPLRPCA